MTWRNFAHSDWNYFGTSEVGVRGDQIPQTGQDGASKIANDVDPIAEAADLFRTEITSPPASGTQQVEIDGSGTYENSVVGVYTTTYRMWKNAVIEGSGTSTYRIGLISQPTGLRIPVRIGTPTARVSSVEQTSSPRGFSVYIRIGTPQASLSDGAQTSSPSGLSIPIRIGTPNQWVSKVNWELVPPETGITWTEVGDDSGGSWVDSPADTIDWEED